MNKVIMIGRLTKDPEHRQVGSSKVTDIVNFTLAVNRRYAAQGQEQLADFPQCVCFGNTAIFAAKYLTKGSKIVVEGRLQTRSYDAQDGSKRFVTEVVVENIEFAESRRETAQNASESVTVNGKQMTMTEIAVDEDQLPF